MTVIVFFNSLHWQESAMVAKGNVLRVDHVTDLSAEAGSYLMLSKANDPVVVEIPLNFVAHFQVVP